MPSPTLPELPEILDLPERADPLADPSLLADLRARRDRPLTVNAARLRQFSAALAELLLVAAADWRARGVRFEISGLSPLHRAQLALLGLDQALPIAGQTPKEAEVAA